MARSPYMSNIYPHPGNPRAPAPPKPVAPKPGIFNQFKSGLPNLPSAMQLFHGSSTKTMSS